MTTVKANGHNGHQGKEPLAVLLGAADPAAGEESGPLGQDPRDSVGYMARDLEALTAQLGTTIARVQASLSTLVHQEFRRAIEDIVGAPNGSGPAPLEGADSGPDPVSVNAALPPPETPADPRGEAPAAGPGDGDDKGGRRRRRGRLTHVQGTGCLATASAPKVRPDEPLMATAPTPLGEDPAAAASTDEQADNAGPRDDEGVYEGAVRLVVKTSGCACQAMHFVRKVCRMPELRLLRLVGTTRDGLELLVGLREPLHLESVLRGMERVVSVNGTTGQQSRSEERQLVVWLVDAPSRDEWGFADEDQATLHGLFRQQYRGARYSWGYPACPDLEDNARVADLLEAGRIGVACSAETGWQYRPEQTTSALICHHPDAGYFVVG